MFDEITEMLASILLDKEMNTKQLMSIPLSWHLLYEEMAKDVHGLELSLDTVERLYTEVELKAPKIDTVEETEIETLRMMLTLLDSNPEKQTKQRK